MLTISFAFPNPMPHHTRRVTRSYEQPTLPHADWCLQIQYCTRCTTTGTQGLGTKLDASNKGFAMLAKMGFTAGAGLGKGGSGRAEPVGVELRVGRGGFGLETAKRKRSESMIAVTKAARARVRVPDPGKGKGSCRRPFVCTHCVSVCVCCVCCVCVCPRDCLAARARHRRPAARLPATKTPRI